MTSTLLSLPSELLHQVAVYLVSDSHVSDIVNFTSTCGAMRASARSLLFRSMTVSSSSKLESLSNADATILGYMREFNIRLEYDFFEAFAAACDPTAFPQCTALRHQSVIPALARILLSAPQLASLRVQIPENTGDSWASAWTELLRLNTQGLPLGAALSRALPPNTTFPALRTLHLDGLAQLAPLARMTPNLVTLSAHMCEGFSEAASREFIENTLPLLPNLNELAFDPFSLHFAGSGLNVPKEIVASASQLQTLDLRSRAFDYGTGRTEWRTTDQIDPLDCVPAGSKLKELYLPFTPSNADGGAVVSEPLKANMRDVRAREAELLAVVQLASASPLEKVSWLRADGEEPIEYSIERDAQGIPADINVLGANRVEEEAAPESQSGRVPPLSGFASMLAKAASSTTLHAAVVMLLISDSSALSFPVPNLFTKPALLATGVALGLGYRTLPF
ncbi:hypothetical protein RhiXN_03889 [Rhizoctonia solani]|uniref:Uncharacterized protein n=1 Tax=Rhizoctonia solani TaxID=456999 RepID=A0A8H7HBQ8_9AGAM|nr:uncharacterized protein RhiXN_03889 [Rhizoctonia solani]KAF8681596.1 hypothetical protein RHS04_03520 [Rhizoctonia solani]QRW15888.1 hypothetical protein RhiXN_03889 [Rhizoctonia solani]